MRVVLPDNLAVGVRYRIHRNADGADHSRDHLGSFVNHSVYGPRFNDLILFNREGHAHLPQRYRNAGPRPFSRVAHTFYLSGQGLVDEKATRQVLNGEAPTRSKGIPLGQPGLGTTYVGHGKRRSTRRRARSRRR
jgi:hypothetical protein